MRLSYLKDELIGVDLYRLAQKYKDAFIVRSILYSHCFEYAITSIPKDIAYDKASDFTNNIDETFDILVKRGFATITDNEVTIIGAPERVLNGLEYSNKISEKQKNYRERQKNKINSNGNEQDTNNEENTDYRPLVQQWNRQLPMTDIQLKTSYARFKASNSWDPEIVKNALEFIGNNPGIKNKIMCDWFEAGFFLPGYEFDLNTINEHFEKKGNNGKVQKSETLTGREYPAYPESLKSTTRPMKVVKISDIIAKSKKQDDDMDPEMKKLLEEV